MKHTSKVTLQKIEECKVMDNKHTTVKDNVN